MDQHEEFTAWAVERGVEINGISAHKWDGRGVGIKADRDIEVSERLTFSNLAPTPISQYQARSRAGSHVIYTNPLPAIIFHPS